MWNIKVIRVYIIMYNFIFITDILITTPKRIIYLLNQDPPAISFNK